MKLIIFIYFSFYIFSALVNIDYISKMARVNRLEKGILVD